MFYLHLYSKFKTISYGRNFQYRSINDNGYGCTG